uniref:Phosphatidylinositol glycan anchor biosynthesis, class C n=1 Tax=Astyanax mexicanus TaxID=7994 RepID=A0A3B1J365_ASTMX
MGADSGPGAPPAVPWRKVLYERQPYPDNYVDRRFLEELQRNIGVHQYRYWAVVREAGLAAQQVSCVAVFSHIMVLHGSRRPGTLHPALGQSWVCTFGTLTASVSTDTVYAMSSMMLLAHLVSFPYTQPAPQAVLSLPQRCLALCVLASRLPGALHTFAMLSCALLVFALWPCLLHRLRTGRVELSPGCRPGVHSWVGGLASLWPGGALLLLLALLVLTLACPMLLVHLQRHKDNIHGPVG